MEPTVMNGTESVANKQKSAIKLNTSEAAARYGLQDQ